MRVPSPIVWSLVLSLGAGRLGAAPFDASLRLKVYAKGEADAPDRRLGFTPRGDRPPLEVPSFGLWYIRPAGPLAVPDIHALADLVKASRVPGVDLSNRWDFTDERLGILARCPSLRFVNVSHTRVTDRGLESLKGLKLESLTVSEGVTDRGLSWLGAQPALRELDLDGSRVSDAGAAAVARWTRLRWLVLSNTRVSDAGLKTLSTLTSLTSLVLGAGMTDASAETLASWASLRSLDASGSRLTDKGLARLVTQGKLRAFYGGPALSDQGLPALASLPFLEVLDLSGSRITDEGLQALGRLQTLRELALTRTPITDHGLARLKGLTHLRVLELSGTRVSAAGLRTIARQHPELETLSVPWSRLPAEGFDALAGLRRLRTVVLDGSPLPESVVRHLRQMAKLEKEKARRKPDASVGEAAWSGAPASRPSANPDRLFGAAARLKSDHPAPLSGLRQVRQIEERRVDLTEIQGTGRPGIPLPQYSADNKLGDFTIQAAPARRNP